MNSSFQRDRHFLLVLPPFSLAEHTRSELPEVEESLFFGTRREATERSCAIFTLGTEAVAAGFEDPFYEAFPAKDGSVAEVADLTSKIVGF